MYHLVALVVGVLSAKARQNVLRVESAKEAMAMAIDERIMTAWSNHPRRFVVASNTDFAEKAMQAVELVHKELPSCCREHEITSV